MPKKSSSPRWCDLSSEERRKAIKKRDATRAAVARAQEQARLIRAELKANRARLKPVVSPTPPSSATGVAANYAQWKGTANDLAGSLPSFENVQAAIDRVKGSRGKNARA